MSPRVDLAEVRPGDTLPEVAETNARMDLGRYAGASGDFNPIHWNDEVA
jgi:acyl dehydratase